MERWAARAEHARRILNALDGALRRAWARCLTGRVFVFTIWTTCAVAALDSAVPPPDPSSSQLTNAGAGMFTAPSNASGIPDAFRPGLAVSDADRLTVDRCWGAAFMRVAAAWQICESPRSTLVAVLDTGIDIGNSHLADRTEDAIALTDATGTNDICGHGTHVAGTIAAIAPNCRLLNVKVMDDRGLCKDADVARGIRLAADRRAAVINLSLEVAPSAELEAAVSYAWERGAVIVAAAGMPRVAGPVSRLLGDASEASTGLPPPRNQPAYPAFYPQVIAVTGTTETGGIAPASNRAPWVDVAAPGYRTYADVPGGHGYLSGTSCAAAHVSGLAALLCGLAEDKNGNGLVNDEVRLAIESTATPMNLEGTGHGIVNAFAAIASLSPQTERHD